MVLGFRCSVPLLKVTLLRDCSCSTSVRFPTAVVAVFGPLAVSVFLPGACVVDLVRCILIIRNGRRDFSATKCGGGLELVSRHRSGDRHCKVTATRPPHGRVLRRQRHWPHAQALHGGPARRVDEPGGIWAGHATGSSGPAGVPESTAYYWLRVSGPRASATSLVRRRAPARQPQLLRDDHTLARAGGPVTRDR